MAKRKSRGELKYAVTSRSGRVVSRHRTKRAATRARSKKKKQGVRKMR